MAICSESNSTASLILPLTDKILKKCKYQDGDSEFSKQIKNAFSDNLSKRYKDINVRDYLLTVTALDPRTKAKCVVEEGTWEKLLTEVVEMLESVCLAKKSNKIFYNEIFKVSHCLISL